MAKAGPCRLSFAAGKKLPGTLWKDNLMAHGTARIGKDHYRTEIEVGGHALVGDEGPGLGGRNLGPAPYDFLLAGIGHCTAITLRTYASSKGWTLEPVGEGPKRVNPAGGT